MNTAAKTRKPADPAAAFDKVGPFAHVVNSALGWLAAFFCAISLLYLSLVVVAPAIFPVMFAITSGWLAPESPVSFAIVGLASSLYFFSGMVIGRFLLRAIPPRLSGQRRTGVIVLLAAITAWYVVSLFLYAFGNGMPASPAGGTIDPLVSDIQGIATSPLFQLLQFLLLVFWWLGFAVPLAVRHWNPRRFLQDPFVLFLRRFSKFPDRAVQHALLKCAPAGRPVAFLTPTRSRAGDWNPFRVGFSGIKLRRPIRSMPVILRATNEDWQPAATELIENAQVVVLDVSEGSGAIQAEIDMIDAADRWSNVVILAKKLAPDTDEAQRIKQFEAKGATIVSYRRSWMRALPRLLFGPMVTFLVLLPVFYLFPMLIRMLINTDFSADAGNQPALSPDVLAGGLFSFSSTYTFVVNVVVGIWIYVVFFVRPALNKAAVKSLSALLKQG